MLLSLSIDWLVGNWVGGLVGWLVGWLADWLVRRQVGLVRLIGWAMGRSSGVLLACLVDWLVVLVSRSVGCRIVWTIG